MAEISAALVMKLRKTSGQGMMDCKKALTEADGDIDKAMEILRKKGLATLAKRAARETSEGIVVSKIESKTGVLVSLCCETDFVAKSDDFIAAAALLSKYAMACPADSGADNILETELDGKKFKDQLTDLVSKTGEKTEVGEYVKYEIKGTGILAAYVHFNRKVGAMVEVECGDEKVAVSEGVKKTAEDIAMHITAINPLALDKSGISEEVIEQEKAIYADQVKGKPAEIIDKIVGGKLNKFFQEKCLLSQPFVKDDSVTVEQAIAEAGKQAGGTAKITHFARISVE